MPGLVHHSIRAFVALAESGTLVSAGERINRTPSAVSLRIAALEHQLGRQLFTRSAHGMQLSPAGHVLLRHARSLLEAEEAAELDLRTAALSGEVRFGMPEDFVSSKLASTLNQFRRAHPAVKVTAIIERNRVIASLAQRAELDIALLISRRAAPRALATVQRASHWYACKTFEWDRSQPIPLVLLDGPCVYRDDAIQALERSGIRWQLAFSTSSVTAMWAAIDAGVGVTVRMDLGAPKFTRQVDDAFVLPILPKTVLSVIQPASSASESAAVLADLVKASLNNISAKSPSHLR
jgi:DNA-binding transcriptional LysR family regulator